MYTKTVEGSHIIKFLLVYIDRQSNILTNIYIIQSQKSHK